MEEVSEKEKQLAAQTPEKPMVQEEEFKKPYEDTMFPVGNDQQLGQDILRTFARVSDPNMIIFKKVRRSVPVFSTKEVTAADGGKKSVEFIERWEIKEWEIPVVVQPEYHEIITDDIGRAFLSAGDLEVYRTIASYCKQVKSFADRYNLKLALHHNNFADEIHVLCVSSGAYEGQRVKLAKTSIAQQDYKESREHMTGMMEQKKKKGFFGNLLNI